MVKLTPALHSSPPKWARHIISEAEAVRCAAAIAAAEVNTAGEIVIAIARRSSPVRHVAINLTLLFLCIGFAIHLAGIDHIGLGIEVAAIPLAILLSRIPWVQRLASLEADLEESVQSKAKSAFYDAGVERTIGATGVLIFISLMEHRVVVLGDKSINAKLPQNSQGKFWQAAVDLILAGIRNKSLASGLISAIDESGKLLQTHFPAQKSNPDEVANHVVFLD